MAYEPLRGFRPIATAIARSISRAITGIASSAYNPLDLFANGEQGAWFDPSDISTMFQDHEGRTPVTASGQPVGLIFDKSRGLKQSAELFPDSDFNSGSTSGWSVANDGSITVADGQAVVTNATATGAFAYRGFPTVIGKTYKVRIEVVSATTNWHVRLGDNTSATTNAKLITTGTTAGRIITGVFVATSTQTFVRMGNDTNVLGETSTYESISIKELLGNHASQSVAANRPLYHVENGLSSLLFDGIDDFLKAPIMDLSASSASTVCTGLHKIVAGAGGSMIYELGTGAAPILAGFLQSSEKYQFASGAGPAAFAVSPSAYLSPHTAVHTGMADINVPIALLRINGVQVISLANGQGTGVYGNQAMYIGTRAGTALPMKANIYGIIIRGVWSDDATVAQIETWMNSKTGADFSAQQREHRDRLNQLDDIPL